MENVEEESGMVMENAEESSSTNCSSGFVKLQIVNGMSEVEDDCETIDEDQPDEDASMIVVTHVSPLTLFNDSSVKVEFAFLVCCCYYV